MKYRKVPKNGDELSILGYGCMRFPGNIPSVDIDRKKASEQLLMAIDKGINYFDTAWPYHNGDSETFLGEFFTRHNLREQVKIATKLPHWITNSKEEMHEKLNQQLKKLQTDYIDYYLVHNLNIKKWEKAKANGVIEFLDEALSSGKVLNVGFSFHGSGHNFSKIVDDYDWTICQIQYNYLDIKNQAGRKGLEYAASKDIGVIIMEPLRGGNLSKVPPKEIKKLWHKSNYKWTPTEWALRWLWDHPEIICVLSGMTKDEHIVENTRIASEVHSNHLTAEEREMMRRSREIFLDLMKVNCTGCYYCMPCPYGVNIPGCFEYYNSKNTFNDFAGRIQYFMLNGIDSIASKCVKCGKCVPKCPQNINIPKEMSNVEKDMENWTGKIIKFIMKLVK